MTTDRLDEIIKATAYPESMSVYQAIYQVENEMQQEFNNQICKNCKYLSNCGKQCNNEEIGKMVDEGSLIVHSMVVYKDFGCNKFERKEL